jgi:hypothetical protein
MCVCVCVGGGVQECAHTRLHTLALRGEELEACTRSGRARAAPQLHRWTWCRR